MLPSLVAWRGTAEFRGASTTVRLLTRSPLWCARLLPIPSERLSSSCSAPSRRLIRSSATSPKPHSLRGMPPVPGSSL